MDYCYKLTWSKWKKDLHKIGSRTFAFLLLEILKMLSETKPGQKWCYYWRKEIHLQDDVFRLCENLSKFIYIFAISECKYHQASFQCFSALEMSNKISNTFTMSSDNIITRQKNCNKTVWRNWHFHWHTFLFKNIFFLSFNSSRLSNNKHSAMCSV